jgi:uncharacterized membrane protein YkvA (DUF1232 family)
MVFGKIRGHIKNYYRLLRALYKDKRTPRISKTFLWIAMAYAISPIDIIPDFIPLIGHIDDAVIVPGLIYIALRFIPHRVYRENYEKIFGR